MSANAWVRRAGQSLGAAALLFSLIFAAPAPVAASGPQPLVGAFHTALLGVMRDAAALGYQGRYDRLTKPLRDSFHLPLMTQVATGSYWRSATADQRDRLVDAFTRLSIGTYAARFSGFSGQSFVTVGQRPGPQKTVLVDTKIVNPGDTDVPLTYVTREVQGAWRIIDVLVDAGISELAVRRSEYRLILKTDGIDGLITVLGDKASALRSGG